MQKSANCYFLNFVLPKSSIKTKKNEKFKKHFMIVAPAEALISYT